MKLNTYRCGCGRIETLPHAKARPGPCVHVYRAPVPRVSAWRLADRDAQICAPPGWTVEERERTGGNDHVNTDLRARKPGRRDLGIAYGKGRRGQALDMLAELAREAEALRSRAEGFFAALRGLLNGIRPATELAAPNCRCVAVPQSRTFVPPGGYFGPDYFGYVIPPGAKVSAPRETPDGRWVCDVEAIGLVPREKPALGPKGRWHVATGLRNPKYAQAAQMYCEGLELLGLRAYLLVEQIRGIDVVRVAFDTTWMEDVWVNKSTAYRIALSKRIESATGVSLTRIHDVPGKRPAWFPPDV